MKDNGKPTQITDTTHQLFNLINPFDRQGSYVLISAGDSRLLKLDKKCHSPARYLGIKNWDQLETILPGFTPHADTYLLPFGPLSESKFRNKTMRNEFVEYQNIYRYFEKTNIRQQPKSTLICLCMLLAENYDEKLGGIPRGIKWLAAKLGTNSRKITVSIKSLEEMGLVIFHKKRADIDKVTLPCFIEPTQTFVMTFMSLFRKGKTRSRENTLEAHTTAEQDYENKMSYISQKEFIYDIEKENLEDHKPDYYLYGKKGFFWYQNQIYTLKVSLLTLIGQPEVDEEIKVHVYQILL